MKNLNLTLGQSRFTYAYVLFILTMTILSSSALAQDLSGCESNQCKDFSLLNCENNLETIYQSVTSSQSFKDDFNQNFGTSFSVFESLNPLNLSTFKKMIYTDICSGQLNDTQIKSQLFSLINQYQADLLFGPVVGRRADVTYIGKDVYIPHEEEADEWFNNGKEPNDGPEKATACLNSDFESGDFSTWITQCGTVNATLGAINGVTNYTLPANCNGVVQHSIAAGGIDPNTGFPRVYPGGGGFSAMIGDGTGSGARAAVVRKTFLVDPTNTTLIYYYSAVLETPAGHTPGEKPFFRARLYDPTGAIDPCAEYFAYGGDGQAGWLATGAIQYRDWTAVFVPLDAYIGQNVTIEFATGDCSQSGHYGYAYVEATCGTLEIAQTCEGVATVLTAPDGGASYLWNTGETTQEISVSTSGTYTCDVTPLGSPCTVQIEIQVTVYPVPNVDILPSESQICIGGEVTLNDNTTIGGGSTITSYQWDFGDGISTPSSSGAITGVAQTSGTYTAAEHTYSNNGNQTVTLTVETSDGCTASATEPIIVTPPPTATIAMDATVCQNDAQPVVTFTGAGTVGPYTFTYNMNGGADQYITTTGGSSIGINIPTTTAGTFTYNLLHVSDPSSPTCAQDQVGDAVIIVNPLPTGTVTGTATVCQDDAQPVITFTGANGTSNYIFTYNINGGANQTITTVGGASTATLNVSTATAGTFNYNLVSVQDQTTLCSQAQPQTATVIVNPMPTATIGSDIVICQADVNPQITFTGNNSSSEYTFTYTINGGANQTVTTSGSNSVTVSVPTATSGTFTYALVSVQDPATLCEQNQVGTAVVTVNPLPTATVTGTATVCQTDADPIITFTGANGSSDYIFTYNINGGANQTISTVGGATTATIAVSTATAGTYNYNLISVQDATTLCSQSQVQTATITVNPMPTGSIAGSTTVCKDDTAPVVTFTGLNGSSEYSFTYTLNGGGNQIIVTNGSNTVDLQVSTAVAGTYVYNLIGVNDVTTLCGQVLDETETIIVNPLPVASASVAVEVCQNDTEPVVTFTGADGTAPYTFTYSLNGGPDMFISTAVGSNDVSFNVPTNIVTTYNYVITEIVEGSAIGCSQVQNVTTSVVVNPLPIIFAGNDISICQNATVILSGSGAGAGGNYVWDNGISNGYAFVPNDTTTYTVIGTDINGCQGTDQVTVNVVPFPTMDIQGYNLYGCAPITATFDNLSSGNLVDCQWSFGNGDVITDCGTVSATFEQAGCYDVTLYASTPEGCSNTLTLTNYICVEPNPIADFNPNPDELSTYNWVSQMENESYGATHYEWEFGDGTMGSTEVNPEHAFPNNHGGDYLIQLVAISDAGCVDTAWRTINVKDELIFYVPNTFTPDGDQYNESFKPVFTAGFDKYKYTLYIFNRWGELVFESHDTDYGWNGEYGVAGNSERCNDGTYTWKIIVGMSASGKMVEYDGHVNLLR